MVFILGCIAAATAAGTDPGTLSCVFNGNSSGVGWAVMRDGTAVFAGNHIAVHLENTWFVAGSTEATSAAAASHDAPRVPPTPPHKPLAFVSSKTYTGTEPVLGSFTATSVSWSKTTTQQGNKSSIRGEEQRIHGLWIEHIMYMYVVLRNAARRVLVPRFFKKKWPCVLLTCARLFSFSFSVFQWIWKQPARPLLQFLLLAPPALP